MIWVLSALAVLMLVHHLLVHRHLRSHDKALRGVDEKQKRVGLGYAQALAEAMARQPDHEKEHGGVWTAALRIEAVARRAERKIKEAGLPALGREELRKRAREALSRPPG